MTHFIKMLVTLRHKGRNQEGKGPKILRKDSKVTLTPVKTDFWYLSKKVSCVVQMALIMTVTKTAKTLKVNS